ncbi:MAG TPA: HEAT repeat domain-containing protein [Vicinamibacterales bacterium]|nr:HEAT repeat domain-containing protein [Vicinamibacterales bacterium]
MRRTRLIVMAVLTLVVASSAWTQSPLTKEDKKFFAWFDGLGYAPSLENLPLVRVWSGTWSQFAGDKERRPNRFLAFLLADDGSRFKVLTLTLQQLSLTRAPASGELTEVKFEDVDLEQLSKGSISAAKVPNNWGREVVDIPGLWASQLAQAVLARACAERRMEQMAHDLLEAARSADLGDPQPRDLFADLSESIAENQYSQALTDLKAGIDRASVRDRLRRMVKNFPKTFFADFARDYVPRLDRMVREERDHAGRAKPLASLEGEARAAELIYQLRDEVGYQFMTPGAVYFLSQDWLQLVRTGPAQQLADIGYPAVPQLIDALQDPALTRTYYYRNGPRSIVAVREAAVEILSRISGLRFDYDEEKWRETQAKAKEWWNGFQRQGERQTLITGTLAGHSGQAELLIKKYPDGAARVLTDALAAATDWSTRFHLVRASATLRPGAELPILRASLLDADSDVQLEAAKALVDRGFEEETVEPLTAAWTSNVKMTSGDELASYLAHLNDPRGIEALGSKWTERTYGAKNSVVQALTVDQVQPANRTKAEDLLAVALDDHSVPPPQSGYFRGGLIGNPRICDVAAQMMAENWSDAYRFDGMASEADRDTQIAAIKRAWRVRRSS